MKGKENVRLEYVSYEEMLRELRLFSLVKDQGGFINADKYLMGEAKKTELDSSQ